MDFDKNTKRNNAPELMIIDEDKSSEVFLPEQMILAEKSLMQKEGTCNTPLGAGQEKKLDKPA